MNKLLLNSPQALELLNEIKEAYTLFASSIQQSLQFQELKAIFRCFGLKQKSSQLKQLLSQKFGKTIPQELTFDQTTELLLPYLLQTINSKEQLENVFNIFDKDQKNYLVFNDLVNIGKEIGENIDQEELYEMFQIADKDQDGALNKEEFLRVMLINQDDYYSDDDENNNNNTFKEKQYMTFKQ